MDPNWQIGTKALREAVRHDEALLKALEAAGNRSGFPASLQPSDHVAGAAEYCGVLHVKLQEVIKGDKIEAGQTIRVRIPFLEQVARPPNVPGKTLWTSPSKAAIEAVGAGHMEPHLRRGLFGLEATPAGAAELYRLLWFNVPNADDWEPCLEQFRQKARLLHGL